MTVTRSRSAWIPGIIHPCKQLTVIHDGKQVTHKTKIFLGARPVGYCCRLSPVSVFDPSWAHLPENWLVIGPGLSAKL